MNRNYIANGIFLSPSNDGNDISRIISTFNNATMFANSSYCNIRCFKFITPNCTFSEKKWKMIYCNHSDWQFPKCFHVHWAQTKMIYEPFIIALILSSDLIVWINSAAKRGRVACTYWCQDLCKKLASSLNRISS